MSTKSITASLKKNALGSTQFYCRTILNPTINRLEFLNSYNQLIKERLNFKPLSVILMSTPQYSKQMLGRLLEFKDYSEDLEIIYGSVDTIAPFSHRNGITELWLNKRTKIDDLKTIKKDLEDKQNSEIIKSGRIISHKPEKNWEINHDNYLSINIPFISKNLVNHYSIPKENLNIKLKLGSTIFENPSYFTTCFYLMSEKERKTLSRMNLEVFKDIKKYLDSEGHYLHELSITLPPFIKPSRFSNSENYNNLELIENDDELRITQINGNLVKKINNKPASSILQDNPKLMKVMNKDSKIFVTLENEDDLEIRRFEVIAGGGAWGSKSDTLAIDPISVNYLKNNTKLKFYLYQPNQKTLEKINNEKLIKFFPNGLKNDKSGLFFENSFIQESYNPANGITDDGSELVIENVFGIGSERKLKVNDVNRDSEGETVKYNL